MIPDIKATDIYVVSLTEHPVDCNTPVLEVGVGKIGVVGALATVLDGYLNSGPLTRVGLLEFYLENSTANLEAHKTIGDDREQISRTAAHVENLKKQIAAHQDITAVLDDADNYSIYDLLERYIAFFDQLDGFTFTLTRSHLHR